MIVVWKKMFLKQYIMKKIKFVKEVLAVFLFLHVVCNEIWYEKKMYQKTKQYDIQNKVTKKT